MKLERSIVFGVIYSIVLACACDEGSNEQDKSVCSDPNAAEVCGDGADNDCDGIVDEGCPQDSCMGSNISAIDLAPLTCRNGVRDNGEEGVDCGGSCHKCSPLPDAEAAIMVKNYYDLHSDWAMGAILNLVWSGNVAYVHYGWALPSDPDSIWGESTRTFTFQLDESPEITAMGDEGSAHDLVPMSCHDGYLDGDEEGVDCGGSCGECGRIPDAEAAVMMRNYYNLHTDWAMGAIYNLVWSGNVAYVHYGWALKGNPNIIWGESTRTFTFSSSESPEITAMGDEGSTHDVVPLSCNDRYRDGDEEGVDCGGSCGECVHISDAEAAVMAKNYYDLHGEWAGQYVMSAIYNLVWSGNVAHVHYGFARTSAPESIEGQDTRTFTFRLDQSPTVTAMGAYNSAADLAPQSCRNGVPDNGEDSTDCGGFCSECGRVSDAEAAIIAKNYYDLHGQWAGEYVMSAIYNLVWSEDMVYVHYGYAHHSQPEVVLGQDSRIFAPQRIEEGMCAADGFTYDHSYYNLVDASESQQGSTTSAQHALINAIHEYKQLFAPANLDSNIEKIRNIFGNIDSADNDDRIRELTEETYEIFDGVDTRAPASSNLENFVNWLPNIKQFDSTDSYVIGFGPGTTRSRIFNEFGEEITEPYTLHGAYDSSDSTIYVNNDFFEEENEEALQCLMIQELAHHIDQQWGGLSTGSEGLLAAIYLCTDHTPTQWQIRSMQNRQDLAYIQINLPDGLRTIENAELGFWKNVAIGVGIAAAVALVVIAPELLPAVVEAGTELETAETVTAVAEAVDTAASIGDDVIVAEVVGEDVPATVVAVDATLVIEAEEVPAAGYLDEALDFRFFNPDYNPATDTEIPRFTYHGLEETNASMDDVFRLGLRSPRIWSAEDLAIDESEPTFDEILAHQDDAYAPGNPSRFVATSKAYGTATNYNRTMTFILRPGENAVDVNAVLGDASLNRAEFEVAVPNRVPPEDIYGMYNSTTGQLFRNPNFVP